MVSRVKRYFLEIRDFSKTFDLNLPIEEWFEEEGVDDEEIKKRL